MGMFINPKDERMKQLYQEEREKLGEMNNPEYDFIALEIAWKRREEEKKT